ncbi:MAG: elongation factor P maturation arginine rhamnosyltransferase EarP [Pseudomonadota bacterium]|nr:elongation factor P maturation arginine rhamnosyltransferase EarP [Pseudomonadota bacterium]
MLWDLFCHVVDNFGDIGVCWRLAADLAARGERVRLCTDDASALGWMAPDGAPGVEVRGWEAAPGPAADVVIEAFGCELPAPFRHRMAAAAKAPTWINLEYLSAESAVERFHGLASPQLIGPGTGLRKWFFYPGFTPSTGGLLCEPGVMARRRAFKRDAWLLRHAAVAMPQERVVSLFCYEQPALTALLDRLATTPTLLLVAAGTATREVLRCLGPTLRRGALRAVLLPWLSQVEFDHLLWAADLNFVRGEDSFVRAQWAGNPFVWQIYLQDDEVHRAKLDAFLDRHGASDAVRAFWQGWNDAERPLPPLPSLAPWRAHCEAWRAGLLAQPDLASQLVEFARKPR